MYVFITIVLIAELIITGSIIMAIHKLDKQVLTINELVKVKSPQIIDALKSTKENTEKAVKAVKIACEVMQRRKERYLIILVKNLLVTIVLFMSKGRRKKILSAIELGLSLRDFLACK